jgi:hypothetical protein
MDLSPIPKTFWHALSAAILVVSIGLIVIAYRSQTVTIEFANTTIALSTLATRTEDTLVETEKVTASLAAEARRVKESKEQLAKSIQSNKSPPTLNPELVAEMRKFAEGSGDQMKAQELQQRVTELRAEAKAVSKAIGELSPIQQPKKNE